MAWWYSITACYSRTPSQFGTVLFRTWIKSMVHHLPHPPRYLQTLGGLDSILNHKRHVQKSHVNQGGYLPPANSSKLRQPPPAALAPLTCRRARLTRSRRLCIAAQTRDTVEYDQTGCVRLIIAPMLMLRLAHLAPPCIPQRSET